MTATSSPTWFNCSFPNTLMAWFLWSSEAIHMPLPHYAFNFPLLRQAPSVYALMVWCCRLVPGSIPRWAGCCRFASEFVKMWKHSVRLFMLVIKGLKIIFPFCCLALIFLCFLLGVRESPLWLLSWFRGLYFGKSASIFFCATVAHSWGFLQQLIRSWTQAKQLHHSDGVCGLGWGGILILADILIRSAIVITLWVSIRHLKIWHFVWMCSVPGWSHAGSWIFR